jgi:hypothetical protein
MLVAKTRRWEEERKKTFYYDEVRKHKISSMDYA